MRVVFKILWWLGAVALVVFGFRALGLDQPAVSQEVTKWLPWASANVWAFCLIFAGGLALGAGIWEEIRGRLLRRANEQEISRLSDGDNARLIPVGDALDYLANHSAWAWKEYGRLNYWELMKVKEFAEFERAARRGDVRVRGQTSTGGKLERIDQGEWIPCEIAKVSIGTSYGAMLAPKRHWSEGQRYYHCACADIDVRFSTWSWVRAKRVYYGVTPDAWPFRCYWWSRIDDNTSNSEGPIRVPRQIPQP
jgi:hypothetical protein